MSDNNESNPLATLLAGIVAITFVTMWVTVTAIFTYDWYRGV